MKILPQDDILDNHCIHRTGGLDNITAKQIKDIVGFKANGEDDPDKVKYCWAFSMDGKPCAVWDYKGSHKYKQFSTWGPSEALKLVFGEYFLADM